jgi:hypothetical protein
MPADNAFDGPRAVEGLSFSSRSKNLAVGALRAALAAWKKTGGR